VALRMGFPEVVSMMGLPTESLISTVRMLSYGQDSTQVAQPIQVDSWMMTLPLERSRWMAPVGHPARHTGSQQCMHADATINCA
jgi:hypothetical protein